MNSTLVGVLGAVTAGGVAVSVWILAWAASSRLLMTAHSGDPRLPRPLGLEARLAARPIALALLIGLAYTGPRMYEGSYVDYLIWWATLAAPVCAAAGLLAGISAARTRFDSSIGARVPRWKSRVVAAPSWAVGGLVGLTVYAGLTFSGASPWGVRFVTYHGDGFTFSYPSTWERTTPTKQSRASGYDVTLTPLGASSFGGLSVIFDAHSTSVEDALGEHELVYDIFGGVQLADHPIDVPGSERSAEVEFSTSQTFLQPRGTQGHIVAVSLTDGRGFLILECATDKELYDALVDGCDRAFESLRVVP